MEGGIFTPSLRAKTTNECAHPNERDSPMRDMPPRHPLFDKATYSGGRASASIATESERERLAAVQTALDAYNASPERLGGRAKRFLPYLLVRAVPGDRGDRPLPSNV